MKKLTTLFILLFAVSGLFAEFKIPKSDKHFIPTDDVSNKDLLLYVNDSCTNQYILYALVNEDNCLLHFENKSYITNIKICLLFYFSEESDLDLFIKFMDLTNIENEFSKKRKMFLNKGIEPITTLDENYKPELIVYASSLGK